MNNKMMKICGKTADGLAKAIGVDADGNLCVKRVWESRDFTAFEGAITDTEMHNTLENPIDLTQWGMSSIRINNQLNSDITVYLYDDLYASSSRWMVDSNNEYPQFVPERF